MKRGTQNGLDAVGWTLLRALQENARLSFAELGRRVGLTAPAAAERVRQMEDAGIIRAYRAEVGLERLGLAVCAVIRVTAPEEKCPALKACVKTLPEVAECLHVTGSDAYVLRVNTASVGHLEAVIETLGRHGTPTTAVVLSAPVAGRPVTEPPAAWPLALSAARRASERRASERRPAARRRR
jgi:Lrp/AsnC family leucine-responsive transcriptional regulator